MKVEDDPKDHCFDEIVDILDSMFKNNAGLPKDKTFNRSIWFLKDNPEYLNAIKPNQTPGDTTGNIMHDIILELSEQNSLKDFNIKVQNFNEKVTLELLESHKIINETDIQKKDYNAEVISNHILVHLKEIEKKRCTNIEQVKNPCLSIAIDHIPQFARGKFHLKLILTELLYDGSERISENNIPVDLSKKEIIFSDNSGSKKMDFEMIPLHGIENYKAEGYHYSGINVSSFKFVLHDSDFKVLAESSEDYMLEILLNNVDSFTDLSKNNITLPYRPTFTTVNKNVREINVKFLILFYVNYQVRDCLLKQIYKIFTTLIISNKQERDKIKKLLSYFKDYSSKIMSILDGRAEKDHCMSCTNCNVF